MLQCYFRRKVVIEKCAYGADAFEFDTWANPELLPPPPPAPPPSPPATPRESTLIALNNRFNRPLEGADPLEAGILIHQFDGYQDPDTPWAPCSAGSAAWKCSDERVQNLWHKVSTSVILREMQKTFRYIPFFSVDGGIVLRPRTTQLLCAYGGDGSTDDNKPQCPVSTWSQCVPGCGNPPDYCRVVSRDHIGWQHCGFDGAGKMDIQPFRPSELNALLLQHAETGQAYEGISISEYEGYNEIVVGSAEWLRQLPDSVEAFFYIDCEGLVYSQLKYPGGGGLSGSCEDAEQYVRTAHDAYLQRYGLTEEEYPLLKVRPDDWEAPFSFARRQEWRPVPLEDDTHYGRYCALQGSSCGNGRPTECCTGWGQRPSVCKDGTCVAVTDLELKKMEELEKAKEAAAEQARLQEKGIHSGESRHDVAAIKANFAGPAV